MNKITNGNAKKQLLFSSSLAIIAFSVNVAIGFWSSPFIVSKLGAEAHGFSSLGSNFTTYMGLVTVAINAFAARYITISLQKNDVKQANQYYTSVFYANVTISLALIVPMILLIAFVNRIFEIPANLVNDVRLQWIIMFCSWMIELLIKVCSTSTFVKNRLDIDHGLSLISHIVRFLTIFILFTVFKPKLWFIGIATFVSSSFPYVGHVLAKRKLLPEIHLKKDFFSWASLKELVSKGIWNTVNSLAGMLMNGFDLVVTNLAVSSMAMGLYSIAQTIPNYLQSLMYTLCNQTTPNLTASYAKGKINEVKDGLNFAMKFNSLLLMVPLCGFFIFGEDFYRLWQYSLNSTDVREIFILSSLVILPMISSIMVQPLLTVNTITAKLKIPVFVNIIMGISNIIIELILIKTTNLGVYAIAGVSSVLLLLRNYIFYPIYSARILSLPSKTFYPTIIRGTICFAIVSAFLYISHSLIEIKTWVDMGIYALVFGAVGEVIVFTVMLGREDKKNVLNIAKQKMHR